MSGLVFREVSEQTRTYHFPKEETIQIAGVVGVAVTETTHRLNLKCGTKVIVNGGWLAIEINSPADWSF